MNSTAETSDDLIRCRECMREIQPRDVRHIINDVVYCDECYRADTQQDYIRRPNDMNN